jgi:hypothetical protein
MTDTPILAGHTSHSTLNRLQALADDTLPEHIERLDGPHGSYIRKKHRLRDRYERERDAYRRWLPSVAEIAPRLILADDEQMTLLLTAIPARPAATIAPGSRTELHLYCTAGAALRRLHDVPVPPESVPRPHLELSRRLYGWIDRAGTLITPGERQLLARCAETISATPTAAAVCHLDFQPRNWLVHHDGRITIVDFEHARIDARLRDFARMAHRQWAAREELKDAYFEGYGRLLAPDEEQLLHEFGAVEALTALVRGTQGDNAELVAHGRATLDRLGGASR